MVSLADALKGLSLTSFENHDAGSQASQKLRIAKLKRRFFFPNDKT
jgi:hypothetical protein